MSFGIPRLPILHSLTLHFKRGVQTGVCDESGLSHEQEMADVTKSCIDAVQDPSISCRHHLSVTMQALNFAKLAGIRLRSFEICGHMMAPEAGPPEPYTTSLCSSVLTGLEELELTFNTDYFGDWWSGYSTPGYLPILNGAAEKLQFLSLGVVGGSLTNLETFYAETVLPSLKCLHLLNFEGIPIALFEKFLLEQTPVRRSLLLTNVSFDGPGSEISEGEEWRSVKEQLKCLERVGRAANLEEAVILDIYHRLPVPDKDKGVLALERLLKREIGWQTAHEIVCDKDTHPNWDDSGALNQQLR
jgi:hypothetical protein